MLRSFMSRAAALAAVLGALCSFGAWGQAVTVVEYYNKAVDAYFITGRVAEQTALDGVADFQRTGMTFQAVAATGAASTLTKICRFYIHSTSPYTSSHFYGVPADCDLLLAQHNPAFDWEDYDFATMKPTAGVCPSGTVGIYRGFRAAKNGITPNHRYSASLATYNTAVTAGYVGEDIALCATSATAATTAVTPPPPGSADCGTFYVLGKVITYQTSTNLGPGGSMTRTYSGTTTTFHGVTATQVTETSGGSTSATMIQEGPTSWAFLGGRSGTQETYFVPPIVYPKTMTTGQQIAINSAVQYSPANPLGNANQTGSITLVGKESVTVPAGTYNACKYAIDTVTTYPSFGSTSTTHSIAWVAPGIGLVKSDVSDTTSVAGFNVASTAQLVATAVQ